MGTIPPAFVDNNLRAFVIGGLLALMLVLIPVFITHKENHGARGWVHKETVIPALGAALIVGAGMLWDRHRPESFRLHAHSYSAILMFVLAGMFVFSTARSTLGPMRHIYYGCAALMLVGFVIGVIAANRYYTVLVVETIESGAFVTFWAVQSVEMWDRGLSLNSTTGNRAATYNRRVGQPTVGALESCTTPS